MTLTVKPENLINCLRVIAAHKNRPSQMFFNALRGSSQVHLRRTAASLLYGEPLRMSDPLCCYNALRKALLEAAGITGTCIADADAQFEEKAKAILSETEENK